jgi:RHS repeat-associated protein
MESSAKKSFHFGKMNEAYSHETNSRLNYINKAQDLESGLRDHGVRKYDEDIGRFTSVDPLWSKYIGWTPYHYCGNDPINASDGNGKDYYLVGESDIANRTVSDLNSEMKGANIEMAENGKLNVTSEYVPKNGLEQSFLSHMSDAKIDVNLKVTDAPASQLNDGSTQLLIPGGYLGASQNQSSGKLDGNQALNIEFSERHTMVGGTSS